ncbi:hypothetical protein EV122DRAFT_205276 [Schizophyllum commune]
MKHVSLLLPSWKRKERSPDSREASPHHSPIDSPRGSSFLTTGSWQDLEQATRHKSTLGSLGVKRTRSKGSSSTSYLDMDEGRRSLHSSTNGFRSLRTSKSVAAMPPSRPAPPPPLYPLSAPSTPARPSLHASYSAPPLSAQKCDLEPIEVATSNLLSSESGRVNSAYCPTELDCIWDGFLREMEEEEATIDPACPSRSRASDALSPPPAFCRSQRETPPPRHCQVFTSSEHSLTAPERQAPRAPVPSTARPEDIAPEKSDTPKMRGPLEGEGDESDDDCDSIIDPLLCFPSPPPLRIRKRIPTTIIVPSYSAAPSLSSSSPSSSPTSDDTPIGTPTTPRAPHPYAIAQMYSANVSKSQTEHDSGDEVHDIFSMYSPSAYAQFSKEMEERGTNPPDVSDLRSCLIPPRSPVRESRQRVEVRAHVGAAMRALETHRSYLVSRDATIVLPYTILTDVLQSSMGRRAPSRGQSSAEDAGAATAVSWGIAV